MAFHLGCYHVDGICYPHATLLQHLLRDLVVYATVAAISSVVFERDHYFLSMSQRGLSINQVGKALRFSKVR